MDSLLKIVDEQRAAAKGVSVSDCAGDSFMMFLVLIATVQLCLGGMRTQAQE